MAEVVATKAAPKIFKSYTRAGFQLSVGFLRPDFNLVVTPKTDEEKKLVEDLLKAGKLYVFVEPVAEKQE